MPIHVRGLELAVPVGLVMWSTGADPVVVANREALASKLVQGGPSQPKLSDFILKALRAADMNVGAAEVDLRPRHPDAYNIADMTVVVEANPQGDDPVGKTGEAVRSLAFDVLGRLDAQVAGALRWDSRVQTFDIDLRIGGWMAGVTIDLVDNRVVSTWGGLEALQGETLYA